jgi:hypothetical protein
MIALLTRAALIVAQSIAFCSACGLLAVALVNDQPTLTVPILLVAAVAVSAHVLERRMTPATALEA